MTKDAFLHIRLSNELKKRIEAAAKEKGQTVTTFVQNALDSAAKRTEGKPRGQPASRRGIPIIFENLCRDAQHGGARSSGESGSGYFWAGYQLVLDWSATFPDLPERERKEKLAAAYALLVPEVPIRKEADNDGDVLAWFEAELPQCLALVPARKRSLFVAGARQAAIDGCKSAARRGELTKRRSGKL